MTVSQWANQQSQSFVNEATTSRIFVVMLQFLFIPSNLDLASSQILARDISRNTGPTVLGLLWLFL